MEALEETIINGWLAPFAVLALFILVFGAWFLILHLLADRDWSHLHADDDPRVRNPRRYDPQKAALLERWHDYWDSPVPCWEIDSDLKETQ